ncbi:MAG: hypothetical protein E5W55_07220, partial [Mesorhizobium sp.]
MAETEATMEAHEAQEKLGSLMFAGAFALDDMAVGISAAVGPGLGVFKSVAAFTGPLGVGISAMYGLVTGNVPGAIKEAAAATAAMAATDFAYDLTFDFALTAIEDEVAAEVIAGVTAGVVGFTVATGVGGLIGLAVGVLAQHDQTFRTDPATPLSGFEPDGNGGFDLNDPVYQLPNYTTRYTGWGLDSPGEHVNTRP